MDEKTLIEQGYVKDMMTIHIQEYDPHTVNDKEFPYRRLSYDMTDTFTADQISIIRRWVNEVNNRFPNIKICLTGTGYTKKEDENKSV